MSTRDIWVQGEDIAIKYLEREGYFIVTKNWTIPGGELDVIAEKSGKTVFAEVKYRTSTARWHARESLSAQKRNRFRKSGLLYATKHGIKEENIQFDFIAIQAGSTGYHLEHFRNIEM